MRNAPTVTATAASLLAFTLWSGAASAQTASADALVQSFSRCRAIATADARLECFDKAAQALEQAVQAHDITIADRKEVRTAQRSLFGFSIGRIPIFGGGDRDDGPKSDRVEQLDTTVVSTQALANGNTQVRVAEGNAVWIVTDPLPFPPRAGAKVKIQRGALGNYFLNIEGQRSVRGSRVR